MIARCVKLLVYNVVCTYEIILGCRSMLILTWVGIIFVIILHRAVSITSCYYLQEYIMLQKRYKN